MSFYLSYLFYHIWLKCLFPSFSLFTVTEVNKYYWRLNQDTRMTLNAVNSFITNTPYVPVGLLFPRNLADKEAILAEVKDNARVRVREIETHFQNWNPTQHKLDIRKFSDEFDTIFWLDSDAVVVWSFFLSFSLFFSLFQYRY